MCGHVVREGKRSRFAFIAKHRETWPVSALCRTLGVSRQGFNQYLRKPETERETRALKLDAAVAAVFAENSGRYGSPRVLRALRRERTLEVGKRRVEESMVRQGLFAARPRKFVVTTRADTQASHAPNLLARNFSATRPNERWVTDITYLRTEEGWVYLAAVLDLYSRKVVGWSMGSEVDTDLALRALGMALSQRASRLPLLHHSDRGCQYTSVEYTNRLREVGARVSMSRKGNCWDNAVAESFFATLKKEVVHRQNWRTRDELELAVFEYIEAYYNRKRMHSAIGYLTPAEKEQSHKQLRHAA